MRIIFLFVVFFCHLQVYAQFKVIFSSRTFHPNSETDTLNTLKAIEDFEIEQLDWMYCDSKIKLNKLTEKNIPFSLAINPMIPDSLGYCTAKFRVLDIEGKPIVAPWMKNWSNKNLFWGCVNNKDFYELFLSKCKKYADLKCYGIFVDDAKMNFQFADKNGCFCDKCLEEFSSYLLNKKSIDNKFNYKEYILNTKRDTFFDKKYSLEFQQFQKKSVIDFHLKWMDELKKYTNNKIKFVTNNYGGNWGEIYSLFDIGLAEINEKNNSLEIIEKISDKLKINKKEQYLSFASTNSNDNFKFILHSYFNNIVCILPWDHVLNESFGDNKIKRYYANIEEIKPIFDFLKNSNLKECDTLILKNQLKRIKYKETIKYIKLFEDSENYYLSLYNDLNNDKKIKLKVLNHKLKYSLILSDVFKTKLISKKKISGTIILLKFQK